LLTHSIVSNPARELRTNKVEKTMRRGKGEERETELKWEAAN
jgi:hypothetical protein